MKPALFHAELTLKDIALKVGISPSAVSLALRNSPKISEKTCKLVQQVAQEVGYRPNAVAKSLAHFRHSSKAHPIHASLGWLNFWPEVGQMRRYPEFEHWWLGAKKSAEKLGYSLEEFACTKLSPDRLEKILLARGITGILLPPFPFIANAFPSDFARFRWELFSVARLGRRMEGPRLHFVSAAQAADTMMALKKMWERGYERIGFVGDSHEARMFCAGYLWATHDLPSKQKLPPLLFSYPAKTEMQKPLEAWLKKVKPDAILTDQSNMPELLLKAGYRVPEDIGLASTSLHNNSSIDAGIDQKPEEIGRVAVLLLSSLITDNDRGTPQICREILVEGEWVDGSTLPQR